MKNVLRSHPYYPSTLALPGWQPLVLPYERILGIFFGTAGVIAIVSLLSASRVKHLSNTDRVVLTWWMITGVIHLVVEGWVVAVPNFFTDTSGNPLSEIWKEYSKADSRYASRDGFTICMEAITAFVEGPLCFVVVYGMLKKAPWRHTLAVLVALGQLYGDVLYFATSWYEGLIHSRPEAQYFWFYFVFINSIWIVIPSAVILRGAASISKAVTCNDRVKLAAKRV